MIANNGDVGIGKIPTTKLDINGGGISSGNFHAGNTTSTGLSDRLLQIGDTSRSNTYTELRTSTSGTGGIVWSDGTANDSTGYQGTVEYSHSSNHDVQNRC